jgi:hypothetical protein
MTMTYDQALEQFNDDMSNSCCDGDRKFATQLLAKRIDDADKAERLRRDWMSQYRASMRDL